MSGSRVAAASPGPPDVVQHCARCQMWHSAPGSCAHDPYALCHACQGPVGFRFSGDDGKPFGRHVHCWLCNLAGLVPALSADFVAAWTRS